MEVDTNSMATEPGTLANEPVGMEAEAHEQPPESEPLDLKAADEAAMATLDKYFGPEGSSNETPEPGQEGHEAENPSNESTESNSGISDALFEAASFAGLDRADVEQTVKTLGVEKATAMVQSLIDKAAAKWGIEVAPKGNDAPPAPSDQSQREQPKPAAAAPKQGGATKPAQPKAQDDEDPIAALQNEEYLQELETEFPEARRLTAGVRGLAKLASDLQTQLKEARDQTMGLAQHHQGQMQVDLYDLLEETAKEGFTGYGAPESKQPTPEQLAARQRVFMGAVNLMKTSARPMRFRDAWKQAHRSLNVKALTTKQTSTQNKIAGVQHQARQRDVLPRSSGSPAPEATDMKSMDQRASDTLAKFGYR